jgi:hypothetical protein
MKTVEKVLTDFEKQIKKRKTGKRTDLLLIKRYNLIFASLKKKSKRKSAKNSRTKKTIIQSLILSKKRFPTKSKAKSWLKNQKQFKFSKLDETRNNFLFRQLEPKVFKRNTFKTITLTKGVKARIGKLK